MNAPVRVVVVDDHPLFREGVTRSLQETGDFTVVGQGGTADEAVRLVGDLRPQVALIDLSMPGGGLEAARRIAEAQPEVRIVVLTASEADDDMLAALKAGATAYVLKGVGSATLVDIVSGATRGESYVSPSLAARVLNEMRVAQKRGGPEDSLSTLTEREDEILRLVATGLSNKEIALRLDLQEKTVKHHMTRVLSKLHVKNRTQAALLLHERPQRL